MNELDEVSNKILNLGKMGYCIVAIKLNDIKLIFEEEK